MPMYTENNNSFAVSETNEKGVDKTKRIVEFYPDATQDTYYDLIEDDGKTLDNTNEAQPVYGDNVKTHFTSSVKDGVATLTAETSDGSYTGYDSNRDITFIVNVSKEPSSISANIGNTTLSKEDFTIVKNQTEFDEATGNVYFYNEAPNLNKYATDGSDFANQSITTSPKLYVKFAKTDVNANAVQLIVNGFENSGDLDKNEINKSSDFPTELRSSEADITPTMIPLFWNEVEGATSYEVETDSIIQTDIKDLTFNHVDLEYHSKHTYRVRAVNADGYSEWSLPIEVTSALVPFWNVPKDTTLSWGYGDSWGL